MGIPTGKRFEFRCSPVNFRKGWPKKGIKVDKAKNAPKDSQTKYIIRRVANCPLKINSFHQCSDECLKIYGLKAFETNPLLEEKVERVVKRFGLPENWVRVADPLSKKFYFWNFKQNSVSWLPPGHPKANIVQK